MRDPRSTAAALNDAQREALKRLVQRADETGGTWCLTDAAVPLATVRVLSRYNCAQVCNRVTGAGVFRPHVRPTAHGREVAALALDIDRND